MNEITLAPGAPRAALRLLLAAVWLAACVLIIVDFPVARPALAIALAAYLLLLARVPRAWLVVVPALMPALDLSPLSGRWLLTEFDLLVLATLAATALHGGVPAGRHEPAAGRHLLLFLTLVAWVGSTLRGLDLGAPFDLSEFAAHRSPYEGLRAVKPLLYAVLLVPPLRRAMRCDAPGTQHLLAVGFSVGLVLLGAAVMWDRGVLRHLVDWHGIYAFGADLLNLSASYRATGLFAAMHTGGAAIDAYLLLALPFAMSLLLQARSAALRLAGLTGFGFGCYALFGTFTRATYLGFAVVVMVAVMVWYRRMQAEAQLRPHDGMVLLLGIGVATGIAALLFSRGGFEALAGGALGFAGGAGSVVIARGLPRVPVVPVLLAAAAIAVAAVFDGVTESKWHAQPGQAELGALLLAAAVMPLTGFVFARTLGAWLSGLRLLAAVLAVTLAWMLAVPSFMGYRMESRFASVAEDMDTRLGHWSDSAALVDAGALANILGNGVGTYARRYFWAHLGEVGVGSFRFMREGGETFLRLGAGDYNLIQRVAVEPGRRYRLVVRLRASDEAAYIFPKLCHKNILYSERYTPGCPVTRISPRVTGAWETHEAVLESGDLGRYGLAYWPVNLLLPHPDIDAVVDVSQVNLFDEQGTDLIANGDFRAGADHWLFISDYSHLAWRAKNIFVHLWVEQGILGTVAFVLLVGAAARRMWRMRTGADLLPLAVIAALPALAVLAMFASILDFPRVTLPLYLALFAALYLPADGAPAVRARR